MIETTVRIERPEGTVIVQHVAAQYDLASVRPADELQHDRDFIWYDVYLAWVPTFGLRRRDILVDEVNLDSLTGLNVRLRVYNLEQFGQDHIEARCQLLIGD